MGWTFLDRNTAPNKTALVSYLTRPLYWGSGYTLIDHATAGPRLWSLVERKADGLRFVALHLMEDGSASDNWTGWGYKDMDETVGPSYYDCPLRILNGATMEPIAYAAEWREKVRQWHTTRNRARQAEKTLEPGRCVNYRGMSYRLHSPAGPRRGWNVTDTSGRMYRMRSTQLAEALRAEVAA